MSLGREDAQEEHKGAQGCDWVGRAGRILSAGWVGCAKSSAGNTGEEAEMFGQGAPPF